MMLKVVEDWKRDQVEAAARRRQEEGWRLAAITCWQQEETCQLSYHFAKSAQLEQCRLPIAGEMPVPSVSLVYPGAFVMENELQDCFPLRFQGLVPDYHGKFFSPGGEAAAVSAPPAAAEAEVQ